MIQFRLTKEDSDLLTAHMATHGGGKLIDIITDNILLNTALGPKERAGVGEVVKFMRSLANDSENLVETKKP